tara:strand:- start:288 stop:461 length:174 start_codon:yes stop_codon:yes gene_type:complete
MPKMTKTQAKKRLLEAQKKIKAVYLDYDYSRAIKEQVISTADMAAIEKIILKCIKRI